MGFANIDFKSIKHENINYCMKFNSCWCNMLIFGTDLARVNNKIVFYVPVVTMKFLLETIYCMNFPKL